MGNSEEKDVDSMGAKKARERVEWGESGFYLSFQPTEGIDKELEILRFKERSEQRRYELELARMQKELNLT